jgi:hypothetical protein
MLSLRLHALASNCWLPPLLHRVRVVVVVVVVVVCLFGCGSSLLIGSRVLVVCVVKT